jgi:hypothetical protein
MGYNSRRGTQNNIAQPDWGVQDLTFKAGLWTRYYCRLTAGQLALFGELHAGGAHLQSRGIEGGERSKLGWAYTVSSGLSPGVAFFRPDHIGLELA